MFYFPHPVRHSPDTRLSSEGDEDDNATSSADNDEDDVSEQEEEEEEEVPRFMDKPIRGYGRSTLSSKNNGREEEEKEVAKVPEEVPTAKVLDQEEEIPAASIGDEEDDQEKNTQSLLNDWGDDGEDDDDPEISFKDSSLVQSN